MAIPFMQSIDMNNLQILNFVVHSAASAPSTPQGGMMWWKSDTYILQVYDNNLTAWRPLVEGPTTSADNGFPLFDGTGGKRIKDSGLTIETTLTGSSTKIPRSDAVKTYIDNISAGLDAKQSVRAATAAPGTLATSFENGDVIDTSVTLATNDRILIKDQAAPAENGIYIVQATGAPVRASDADSWAELISAYVWVEVGTANADKGFVCTADAGGTLGSTSLPWTQFNGAGGTHTFAGATHSDVSLTSLTTNDILKWNGTNWVNVPIPASGGSHTLLGSSTHTDTTNTTVLRGMMIIGNSTPAWAGLAIGTANKVLASDGTDPSWTTLGKSHLLGTIVYTDQANSYGDFAQTFKDNRLVINNPADTFAYTITAAAIGANRILYLPAITADDNLVALGLAQTFTAAQTFRAANAVRSEVATTQDAMILAGRAGGTSSYAVTLTPTTLTASRIVTFPDSATTIPIFSQVVTFSGPSTARTYTLPDSAQTLAGLAVAQTWTAVQTFRVASAIRSEAAATQDAVVIAGRAGGSSSYAVTIIPTTLSGNRTLTLADGDTTLNAGTVAVLGTAQTFTAAQVFRAANAVRSEAASTQDAMILAGRAGGSNSYAITLTPTTLTGNRTFTFPDAASFGLISSYHHTIAGPTAARTFTFPDASTTIVGLTDTQVMTNKTFNTTDNSLTATSQAAGDILVNNATKFVRLARGSALTVLSVNSGGTDIAYQSLATLGAARIITGTPTGTGVTTLYYDHNLNTQIISAFILRVSDYTVVQCEVVATTVNRCNFVFGTTQTGTNYRVIIIG